MNEVVFDFVWLLEICNECGGVCGKYANKPLSKVTDDAWDARWFDTKEEAERFIDKAPRAPDGFKWCVTEHGFSRGVH